jgi:hypothetical protein
MYDDLDINSPRGEATYRDMCEAVRLYEKLVPTEKIIFTPKKKPCKIDLQSYERATAEQLGCIEVKCRYDVTYKQFFAQPTDDQPGYRGYWLITAEHIESAALIAKSLFVPLYGWLYIVKSRVLLIQLLATDEGELESIAFSKLMPSQATCNGGTTDRLNFFFDMRGAGKLVGSAGDDPAT